MYGLEARIKDKAGVIIYQISDLIVIFEKYHNYVNMANVKSGICINFEHFGYEITDILCTPPPLSLLTDISLSCLCYGCILNVRIFIWHLITL